MYNFLRSVGAEFSKIAWQRVDKVLNYSVIVVLVLLFFTFLFFVVDYMLFGIVGRIIGYGT